MPLSDREQRILEEIEKSILREDPAFGREAPSPGTTLGHRRRLQGGAALVLAGFVALILFFVTGAVAAGVIAFGAMVGGIVVVAGAFKDKMTSDGSKVRLNDRLGSAARSWEERFRDRYRKR